MGTSTVTPPPGYALDKPAIDLSAGFVPKQAQAATPAVSHPLGDVTGIDHDSGLPIVKRGKPKVDNGTPDVQPKVDSTAVAAGEKTAKEPALKPEIAEATNKRQPIGKTDPESDRKITQPSDNPAANQALATDAMPEFRKGVEAAIKGINGAKLAADRPAKNPKRLAEKIEGEDQPAETVSDYGAAQVSVDSPEAKDAVVAAIKKQFPIVKEDDTFDKGDKDYGYRAHTLQVQMPNKASVELQIVPKEVFDANADEHGNYKAAREADLKGDTAAKDKNAAAAKTKNDAAMAAFNARNGAGETKYKFGNTQANLPKNSDAYKAIHGMQSRIPKEHLANDGKDEGTDEPHVTVRYGIKGDDTGKLKDYISKQAPFDAKLGKTTAFPVSEHSDGAAPIVAHVESPELHKIHAEIAKHGDFAAPNFPEYKPHVTVGYVKPEYAQRYTGMKDGEGKIFKVGAISISDRNGNKEDVRLGGGIQKGSAVTLPDGTRGTVSYLDPNMKIARVKTAAGKSVTMAQGKLKATSETAVPEGHVLVQEHVRKLPTKSVQSGDSRGA